MKIDEKTVLTVARLARLRMDPSDVGPMTETLHSILTWFDELRAVDTTNVEPATHAIPLTLPMRDDVVSPTNSVAELMQNAPHAQYNLFVVPKVVES